MPFWVYMLRCADGSYYTGHTDGLERRIAQHHAGTFDGYSKGRRPVAVVFVEEFPARADALERERQIKRWGRAKKEALARGDWEGVQAAARNRQGGDGGRG